MMDAETRERIAEYAREMVAHERNGYDALASSALDSIIAAHAPPADAGTVRAYVEKRAADYQQAANEGQVCAGAVAGEMRIVLDLIDEAPPADAGRVAVLEAMLNDAEIAFARIRDLAPPYMHNQTPYDHAVRAIAELHAAWFALSPIPPARDGGA